MGRQKIDVIGSFWSHVCKKGPMDCWEWTGCTDKDGYGRFRRKGAHRIAYMITKGPIGVDACGNSLLVLHHCDNKICMNPNHLYTGTTGEGLKEKVINDKDYQGLTLKEIIKISERMILMKHIKNKLVK